ncbi:hypothetical protein Cni_G28678 [Canna indica]|uniref:Endonuclease/exonuclease/phosphatase domain-containing protein n=1 Tax=Canna indica TaxID=4628 RepID=A0AAQ3QSJ5_9LILI|nr:hypothetical protein Cni_G28678 [Canna indica]
MKAATLKAARNEGFSWTSDTSLGHEDSVASELGSYFHIGGWFLALTLKHTSSYFSFVAIGVYGPPSHPSRPVFLQELHNFISSCLESLLVGGHFNITTHNGEHLNCMGSPFTWTNNQNPLSISKLDRILISNSLALAFPELFGRAGDRKLSDHHPLLLRMAPDRRTGAPLFRIENSWLLCDHFKDIIKAGLYSPPTYPSSLLVNQQFSSLKKWLSNWKPLRCIILDWDKTRKRNWKVTRLNANDRLHNLNQRADSSSLSSAELEELKQTKVLLDRYYNNECIY